MRDATSPYYRPDIDGLRAVAILLVLLFHAFPSLCPGGFTGVDVFFVISGYLITGIILRDLDRGRFSFLDFYARRFRRIVPALVVVLAAVFVAGRFLLLPNAFARLGLHIAAAATFTLNGVLFSEVGYFDAAAATKPLLHLWSLAVEEQYYLVWPLLLVLAQRLRTGRVWLFAGLFAASFIAMLAVRTPFLAFYMLPFRFWELLLGGGLALAEQRGWRLRGRAGWVGGLALACLLLGAALPQAGRPWPNATTLLPTLGAALLIACGPTPWINRVLLGNRPAVLLGLISYPLYLWHWPLLVFARIRLGHEPSVALRLGLLVAATGLAWLTWRLVETNVSRRLFARLARRPRNAASVATALATLVLFLGGGAYVYGMERVRPPIGDLRSDIGQENFSHFIGTYLRDASGCPRLEGIDCRSDGLPITHLLMGDSHAEQYMPGLLGNRPELTGWLVATKPDCPAGLDLDVWAIREGDVGCAAFNRQMLDYVRSTPSIRTVLLASLWGRYFQEIHDGIERFSSPRFQGTPEAIYTQALAAMVRALLATGRHVVLIADNPGLPVDIDTCVRQALARPDDRGPICAFSRAAYETRVASYHAMLARIAADNPGVRVYDGANGVCDATTCAAVLDGRALYRDWDHFSAYGSRIAADRLLRWLGISAR